MSTPLDIATAAAMAADEKKASDIIVLDVSEMSDVTDFLVVCTTQANPQTNAVIDAIEERVRVSCGDKPLSVEGKQGLSWVLIDYGCVVVHVMQEAARDFYRIEKLWGDAPRTVLGLEGEAPADALAGGGELKVEVVEEDVD